MTSAYGNNFIDQFGDKDSGLWFEVLGELRPNDIAYGLKKMLRDVRYKSWPPKPAEFLELCQLRAKDLGLPTTGEAFEEMQSNLRLTANSCQALSATLKVHRSPLKPSRFLKLEHRKSSRTVIKALG